MQYDKIRQGEMMRYYRMIIFLLFITSIYLFACNNTEIRIKKRIGYKDVEKIIKRLKIGMTMDETKKILKPLCLDTGYFLFSGRPITIEYFHLKGDFEIVVRYYLEAITDISKIKPKSRWDGLLWVPSKEDVQKAIQLVEEKLNGKYSNLSILSKREKVYYSVNPHEIHPTIVLKSKTGKKIILIAYTTARYCGHKVIFFTLHRNGKWISSVAVDMVDKIVGAKEWTPTEKEIENARKIADPHMRDVIHNIKKKGLDLQVSGYGYYKFSSKYWRMNLSYEAFKKGKPVSNIPKGIIIDIYGDKIFVRK